MTESSSQVDNEYRAMRQMIQDSDQIHAFLNTQIGQKLMRDIDAEVDAFTEKLKKADAENISEIKRLQEEIWRREYLKVWFNTVLLQGEAVLEAIEAADTNIDF